jgi:glycosyltransferase involved in cell wall biosynthesis
LRVAMIGEFPQDFDHPTGGVQAVTACLVRGLEASGVDVEIVDFCAAPSRDGSIGGLPRADRRVEYIRRRRPGVIFNWLLAWRRANQVVEELRPDVVHVQGIPELYRKGRLPAVLTVHGLGPQDALYGDSSWARPSSWILRATGWQSMRHYSDVIAISPYVRMELETHGGARYHDIPNPVEDLFFEVARRPEAMTALYVGVLSKRKNIVGLIRGFARARRRFTGAKLRLAGSWYGNCEASIRNEIRDHALGNSVTLLGSLRREQLMEELTRCSCMTLASFQETAPMAIAEAMASGVPVVASRVGGVKWMVDHGRTGLLFAPADGDELGAMLGQIFVDPQRAARMGEEARKWANVHYRLESIICRTLRVYEMAIASPRVSASD